MTPRRWRQLSVACLGALIVVQLAWHGLWFPARSLPQAFVLALAVGPLLLALAACAWDPRHGLLLAGFAALFYFSHGVMEAWTLPAQRLPALAAATLAALQIVAYGAAAVVEKRLARAATTP